ncbi:stress-response A/B barrel domain-containing protein UP3-like [Vicia villosa]|uniref:stress-response A/B barrel domain-containing protein UP3-like n=1 Tax=Vicia villosa TaxID=3911 RepID=UPI00273BDE2A|nr:stress-response A/B barrel domain-containing protein UP3-like [Vicia villosa]
MINEMQSLVTLEQVRHLTLGPILTNNESISTTIPISDLRYTHLFHSRYDSEEDLQTYNVHSKHINAVRGFIFPICDDLLVVDWIGGEVALPPHPSPGTAFRVSFLKLKEENEKDGEVKEEVFRAIRGIKESNGGVNYVSYGENISPARAKGLSIASLVVFAGREELESVDAGEGLVKVKEHLESVVVVDYVVPLK